MAAAVRSRHRRFPHQTPPAREGRFALAGAKSERRLPARTGPAPEVPASRRRAGRRHCPTCLRGRPNRRHSVGRVWSARLLGWTHGRHRDPIVAGHGP
ncbi:hypothetical protein B1H29_23855 [Streptomyces pactum]|uniref:Uncharacterized protein n=1 Tax=Streptomyces pactum TaxID=68249 RepID=A0A1S6JCN4_9ACTN|nr:hypothetical protein B1H29_23855 [Streptomyces pactum]